MSEANLKNLDKIVEIIAGIKEDEYAKVTGGSAASCRRTRVALSNVSKLCKDARKELLAIMKS